MVLGSHFGDYRAGFRFGTLALDLVETRGLDGFKARVFKQFGAHVSPWTQHLRAGRTVLRKAFDVAVARGDLTFAAYSCNAMISIMLASGDPLADVQREAEKGIAFARTVGLGRVIDILITQIGLIRTLRGVTPDVGTFGEQDLDEDGFAQRLNDDQRLVLPACWYWIRKLQAAVFAADYESALDAAGKAQERLWVTTPFFEVVEYHFYTALARAAACDATSADARQAHLEALQAHSRQLAAWATAGPENFGARVTLVSAEIARLDGRDLEAMRLYEEAIQLARHHGFVDVEALAHEIAARYYSARGVETMVRASLQHSRSCYLRWGADGKVRQLDGLHPHLLVEPSPAGTTTTMIGAPVEHLDVATVVRASHAVSGEIVLGTLIETLIRLAVEHAGADRGLLILLRNDEPGIAAEATTGSTGIVVALRVAAVTPRDLPESALHYVLRTREPVRWDDGVGGHDLAEDDYVRERRPRSVLCLPIVKQNTSLGAFYLENSLTSRAFTAGRVALLELLAAQAAISLENARLYGDLRRNESDLADLAGRLIHAQEEESRRIGRELHDHISQRLALLAIRLDQAAAAAPSVAAAALRTGFADRAQDVRDIAQDIHRLSHRLHSTMLDHLGFVPALKQLVAEFSDRHRVAIVFAPGPLPPSVSQDVSLCLFRIVEEALTNVAKHSGAQSVHVSVVEALDGVRVSVDDDGAGFDPKAVNRGAGLGLMSMRERVRLVHGTLHIESAAAHGTRVDAWAPAAGTASSP
jgi:signal transduction histidine kinase